MSVDHQHNLDHTSFKVILNFHTLSPWSNASNGRSEDQNIEVFEVPGSNPM